MRLWIVIIALAGFVPQLFACCAQDCGACTESETADEHHVCCHEHDDAHDPASSSHDESSHHLCVATHVFYVVRGHDPAPQPDRNTLDVVLPSAEVSADSSLIVARSGISSLSVPPSEALRSRAELGVWTL